MHEGCHDSHRLAGKRKHGLAFFPWGLPKIRCMSWGVPIIGFLGSIIGVPPIHGHYNLIPITANLIKKKVGHETKTGGVWVPVRLGLYGGSQSRSRLFKHLKLSAQTFFGRNWNLLLFCLSCHRYPSPSRRCHAAAWTADVVLLQS